MGVDLDDDHRMERRKAYFGMKFKVQSMRDIWIGVLIGAMCMSFLFPLGMHIQKKRTAARADEAMKDIGKEWEKFIDSGGFHKAMRND